jgi:hypothetical protein
LLVHTFLKDSVDCTVLVALDQIENTPSSYQELSETSR